MVFERPVVPFERWYLGFPRSFAPVMNLCVEGIGTVDLPALRAAVAAASSACPGARLRRRGKSWVDSGVTPPVRVVSDISLKLRLPRGHQCEVLLVGGTTVVFRASHAVMDARGLKMWATEVFRALRGDEPVGAASALTALDIDEPLLRQADASCQEFSLQPAVPMGPGPVTWHRRTVDGTQPAVVAKVASELARLSGLPVTPISVPVDLRVFHPGLDSTSNLALTVSLDVPAGQSWEATHQQLLTVLAEREGTVHAPGEDILRAPLPLLRMMVRSYHRRARREGTFSGVAAVNNLGRVDPEAFSTDGFAATGVFLLAPPEPGGPPNINIVEFGGRTEMTIAWWSDEGVATLLDTLASSLAPPPHVLDGGPATGTAGVVEQFAAQVRATPSAVAISGPGGSLTYAELDRRARGVATALRERGVGPGSVVGLLSDRTADAIVAAWGVLLAGAAYLPMDAKHPDGRLRSLLSDAGSPVCLVQRAHSTRACLPDGCAGVVLEDLAASASDAVFDPPSFDDLAYVVYTSGSTGKPKGVEISHGALSNYASWACREHGITASTRLPLLCSLSFDVAEITLILPLLVGGTVLLMGDELNHVALQEVFDAGATALALTPSHLDLITRLELDPRSVGTLMVIGEQFTRAVAVRAREMFGPECRIINLYGPAEATIGVSHHFYADDPGASVPIGVPLDGVTFHVLSADRAYVPVGESGELYIGGVQLARGYRGRPDLTRQRFVHLASGERVYRTGDIVRQLPSGALEYLGRIDDQVKVHGHRIEPAEIALTLESHPSVSTAVVVARSRPGQRDKVLVGYVIGTASVDELTSFLGERLPTYMVPSVIMQVSDIPRSVNGKVAVSALPDPFASAGPAVAAGPLDDNQAAVARIFASVLQVDTEAVSGTSDFHVLGGDSVSLIAMVAVVARELVGPVGEKAFTLRMPDVIKQPTVERVAELVAESRPV